MAEELSYPQRYNLRNLPPAGVPEVAKFFNGLWEVAKREKIDHLRMHDRWVYLHKLFRGYRRKKKYARVAANWYFKTVHGYCAILTEKTPIAEVQAEDDIPPDQTRAMDVNTAKWWKTQHQQDTLFATVQNMSVYGTTVEKCHLDKDTIKLPIRDPFNFFPAPGYKMATVEELPYCCDADFIDVYEIHETFGIPLTVQIKADAVEQLFGGERETVKGGKPAQSISTSHWPSSYVDTSGPRSGITSEAYKNKALVVELWVRDNRMAEIPQQVEAQAVDNEGNPVFDDQGRPVMTVQEGEPVMMPVYPDGIRKITFMPGNLDIPFNNGVLDDQPNPSINWALVDERIKMLQESGIPEPVINEMTGQPAMDPQTGQPVIQMRPVDELEAIRMIWRECDKNYFLWGRFPFIVASMFLDTSQYWGFSVLEQIEELIAEAEDILTRYAAYFKHAMFPILINPEGSGVDNSEIGDEPGCVLNPTMAAAMQKVIYYLEPPPPPRGLLDYLLFLLMQVDIISFTPEVSEGRKPKGVAAASAIIALQDKVATLFQPLVRKVDEIVETRGNMFISMVMNWGTEEEPIRVDEQLVKFVGIDLMGQFQYHVESGSSAPITKAGRRQQYIELYRLGALDVSTLLERLEIPNWERIAERVMEQNSVPGAIDILVQAGLPQDIAAALYQYVMQPQGGSGEGKTAGGGKRPPTAPAKGLGESEQAMYGQMDLTG